MVSDLALAGSVLRRNAEGRSEGGDGRRRTYASTFCFLEGGTGSNMGAFRSISPALTACVLTNTGTGTLYTASLSAPLTPAGARSDTVTLHWIVEGAKFD